MSEERALEQNFEYLNELLAKLSGEMPLDEAFATYSEGMKILKTCNDQIDQVEKQVMGITGEGEQVFE